MNGKYVVEFSDNDGSWPPVKQFYTEDPVVADLFDGWSLDDVRKRVAQVQQACTIMLSKLEEWQVP